MSGNGKHRHHPVQERVWNDPNFRALSCAAPNAQTLWLFFLTCEYRRLPGVIIAGRGAIADGLRWDVSDVDRCFTELESRGMAVADWPARVVYLVSTFKSDCNAPAGANAAAAWRRAVNDIGSETLRVRIHADIRLMLQQVSADCLECYDSGKGKNKGKNYRKVSSEDSAKNTPYDSMKNNGSGSSGEGGAGEEGQGSLDLEAPPSAPRFDFDALYARYPRKEGKGDGMKAANRLIKTQADYDRFAAAVDGYAAVVRREGRTAVLMWSTFVNGRWEDYAPGAPALSLVLSAPPGSGATPPTPVRASANPLPRYRLPDEAV